MTNTNKPFIWEPSTRICTSCKILALSVTANPECKMWLFSCHSRLAPTHQQTESHAGTNILIGCFPSLSSLRLNETRKCARMILSQQSYSGSQAFTPGTIKRICSRCAIQTISLTRFICLNHLMSRRMHNQSQRRTNSRYIFQLTGRFTSSDWMMKGFPAH